MLFEPFAAWIRRKFPRLAGVEIPQAKEEELAVQWSTERREENKREQAAREAAVERNYQQAMTQTNNGTASELEVHNPEFSAWLAECGYDEPRLTDMQREHLGLAFKASSGFPQEHDAITGGWYAQQRQAMAGIGQRAINEGWDKQKTQLEILRQERTISPARLLGGNRGRPSDASVLSCSLAGSMGVSDSQLATVYDPMVVDAATARGVRGAGLHAVVRAVLASAGEPPPVSRISEGHVRRAFEISLGRNGHGEMYSIGPSTINISGILSDASNKTALAAYRAVNVVWPRFCKLSNLNDFKPHKMYRLTGDMEFRQIAPAGQIQHGTLGDQTYTVQADTFGRLIGIDRRDWINDDLSMLSTVPALIGRKGALYVEKAVFTLLLANTGSFFDDTVHLNKITTALGLTGLDAAHKLFMQQLDDDGDPTLIVPTVLLTPPAKYATGRSLATSTEIIDGTASATQPSDNPWVGMFDVIQSPYMAQSTGLSGASDTAWYLLSGPSDFSVINCGFLEGRVGPTIETEDLSFDRLGVAMRGYLDFGLAFHDFRGGVFSTGAG